jgi:hypothetical protein
MFRVQIEERIHGFNRAALRTLCTDLAAVVSPEVAGRIADAPLDDARSRSAQQLELGPVQMHVVAARLSTVVRGVSAWGALAMCDDLSARPNQAQLESLKVAWARALDLCVDGGVYQLDDALRLVDDAVADGAALLRLCGESVLEALAASMAPVALDACAKLHLAASATTLTPGQFERSRTTIERSVPGPLTRQVWKAMATRDGFVDLSLQWLESVASWTPGCQSAFAVSAPLWDEIEFGRALAVAEFHQHRSPDVATAVIRVLIDRGRLEDAALWLEDAQRTFPDEEVWDQLADRLA